MSKKTKTSAHTLPAIQEERFLHPTTDLETTINTIYKQGKFSVGWPKNEKRVFEHLARPNTVAIVGVALGDEGKGRIVDNKIETMLKNKKIKQVTVVRFQGGSNAGHTVEKEGIKLALHHIPSFIFHERSIGVMDRGMTVHPEDLEVEVAYVENAVGSLKNRLFLSDDAILCTDLERAEEFLNGFLQEGSKGGTGRGIGPSYAHHYDKTGLRISDLLEPDWETLLSKRYEQYEKMFAAFDIALSEVEVPDFAETVGKKKATKRKVGSKKQFLTRLKENHKWVLRRNFVMNTFPLHQKIYQDIKVAIVFEGAQAAGLDVWTGTRPDVTSTNTTVYGIREGTGFWRLQDIEERIGILKLPYTSSVGARRMPTHIDLPKESSFWQATKERVQNLPGRKRSWTSQDDGATDDQQWASYVRETAHEYGTTTGRPRDINFIDLPFISYNARMSGVEMLMGTHIDICRAEDEIKICTHYTDKKGNLIPYQPGLRYLKDIIPNYISVPGWDGEACRTAKKPEDLPIHALKFLSFIQTHLGFPFTAITTGPSRRSFITF